MIHSEALKITSRISFIILIALTPSSEVAAQIKPLKDHDYLLAPRGKSMLEVYSGLPYVAIGQYSYSFSNNFSAGIIYGYTPFVKGFGFRIKSRLAQPSENVRITLKSPFIYYPKSEGQDKEPWVLAWPAVNVEWKLKNNARVWAGVGVIGAACVEYLFKDGSHMEEHMEGDSHDHAKMEAEMEKMFSVWNTFQVGYSKPISNNLSYVVEVAPVMEGLKLKSPDGFLDALPVIVTLGFSYSL